MAKYAWNKSSVEVKRAISSWSGRGAAVRLLHSKWVCR